MDFIINQIYMAMKKSNVEKASYIANLEQTKSVTYKVTGHAIEYHREASKSIPKPSTVIQYL